jgi:hypothetical protein
MFALIFMWTPPHFWALALFMKDDYDRAGVPMLTVTHGRRATRNACSGLHAGPCAGGWRRADIDRRAGLRWRWRWLNAWFLSGPGRSGAARSTARPMDTALKSASSGSRFCICSRISQR